MDELFAPPSPPRPDLSGRLFAQVALERGMDSAPQGLTYLIPEELKDLREGDRVLVPLGRSKQPVAGYVLQITTKTQVDPVKLKPIAARDRRAVNLPPDLIELARWISTYYCCPLGMVFAAMLPAAVKHGTGLVNRNLVQLHDPITTEALPTVIREHKLPRKQADVLRHVVELASAGKLPADPKEIAHTAGAKSVAPVNALLDKALLKRVEKTEVRAVWQEYAHEPPKDLQLNEDQQLAVDQVVPALNRGFQPFLLHGVTGSGKTEVYIRIIEQVVAAGRTAIVLVPEISLTPQTASRFISRFQRVAVLHSGLTASQRHEQWLLIRDGWAQVVIGARSAVFAPLSNLGLIIVDEEHDNSYKQDQAPRYNGRDVAVKRAQVLDVPVLLGSATPSLESFYNAAVRKSYQLVSLPRRVSNLTLPPVEIVDLSTQRQARTGQDDVRHVHLLSLPLERALAENHRLGAQAILLLNRRGYANFICCPDHRCGWLMTCDHCDVTMVYHRDHRLPTGGLVRCHYCGFENRLPKLCPVCEKKITTFGLGTQRVEAEIERKFPHLRFLRMDSDTMNSGRDYQAALDRFRAGDLDLLIGTQMIAKGLDFPNVRLVGIISADTALNLPDFRATERTFQLIAQVAGRSGRSTGGGQVVVQTFTPGNPAVQLAAQHDYLGFARMEMEHRQRAGFPPITRMARIVTRDQRFEAARDAARELLDHLQHFNDQMGLNVRITGPLPPAIARIGGFHRQELRLLADTPMAIQQLIGVVRRTGLLRSDARTAVDVDPVSLL